MKREESRVHILPPLEPTNIELISKNLVRSGKREKPYPKTPNQIMTDYEL